MSTTNSHKFILSGVVTGLLLAGGVAFAGDKSHGKGLGFSKHDYDFREPSAELVELGRNLMFDKILSGNQNISCATCHHSLAATGDGLSLPVGEGGKGLGITRNVGSEEDGSLIEERVPRNAPPVFNLGDNFFSVFFHDGRVEADASFPSGCKTPAGENLPGNLDNVLACQAMFPVTSAAEMAGQPGENPIADAAAAGNLAGPGGVWEQLTQRLQDPANGYIDLFEAAFPDGPNQVLQASDITYAHAANAIAAFEGVNWRADNSPFDRYVRGDRKAMSRNAVKGMKLFYKGDDYGNACADCHSGLYQTDLQFYAIAMPQIGPGRGQDSPGKTGGHEDFGRSEVTGDPADTLKFRTPPLRNIALTAPYGHAGAYNTLRAAVEHHLDAINALYDYNNNRQAVLPTHPTLDALNYVAMDDPDRVDFIAEHNELGPMAYSEKDVDRIIDFLNALTDPASLDLRKDIDVVNGVASGLSIVE